MNFSESTWLYPYIEILEWMWPTLSHDNNFSTHFDWGNEE